MTDATPTDRSTGTFTVKRGLAEMLRGGVIMDVVDAEQAKIAEDAGAVAVMALERVPADIRRDGGVARMSDPALIEGIKAAVTIPVMAKARIGHFAEAQVLEALGVDYIDESEVLTPADEAHHIDKWAFEVPFVCGATNLGEALRRISEGAAMIRSKGEAGTGNIVEAVRHLRSILGDIRRVTEADSAELYGWAKELAAPIGLVEEIAETGRLPVPLFCAGGIATPADASLVMQLGAEAVFVGSGIFKSSDPAADGPGHRRGHGPLRRRGARRQGLDRPRRGHARPGDRHARRAPGRPRLVARARRPRTGAPAGDDRGPRAPGRRPRARARPSPSSASRSARCAGPGDLDGLSRAGLPGGESTTLSLLLGSSGLAGPLGEALAAGLPVFGTCAGMILLATTVLDGRDDQVASARSTSPCGATASDASRLLRGRRRGGRPGGRAAARRLHPGPGRRGGGARGRGPGYAAGTDGRRPATGGVPAGAGPGGRVPSRADRRTVGCTSCSWR